MFVEQLPPRCNLTIYLCTARIISRLIFSRAFRKIRFRPFPRVTSAWFARDNGQRRWEKERSENKKDRRVFWRCQRLRSCVSPGWLNEARPRVRPRFAHSQTMERVFVRSGQLPVTPVSKKPRRWPSPLVTHARRPYILATLYIIYNNKAASSPSGCPRCVRRANNNDNDLTGPVCLAMRWKRVRRFLMEVTVKLTPHDNGNQSSHRTPTVIYESISMLL